MSSVNKLVELVELGELSLQMVECWMDGTSELGFEESWGRPEWEESLLEAQCIDAFNCSAPGLPPLSGPLCLWDVLQGARPCFG